MDKEQGQVEASDESSKGWDRAWLFPIWIGLGVALWLIFDNIVYFAIGIMLAIVFAPPVWPSKSDDSEASAVDSKPADDA